MKSYLVNEIFYSIQGEGFWTGTPAIFLRLALCNLKCHFCDTDFSTSRPMTADDILAALKEASSECQVVVLTGGEPALQADTDLIDALHGAGYSIHIETNGTKPLPEGIDWITLSPKSDWQKGAEPVISRADELKLVYTGQNPEKWLSFPAKHFFLQPCSQKNTSGVLAYILEHPGWRLSLQIHKYLDIR